MVTLNWLLKKVAQGAHADLISIDNEGNITEQEWEKLDAADVIIFGAPTYMGGAPWQFKKLGCQFQSVVYT